VCCVLLTYDYPWPPAIHSSPTRRSSDLAQLSDTPDERRGAAFVCAAAVVTPNGMERVVRGEWEGALARESRGNNGFGYDPIFVPDRKSTRLNSSHVSISYAVLCLKKKKR